MDVSITYQPSEGSKRKHPLISNMGMLDVFLTSVHSIWKSESVPAIRSLCGHYEKQNATLLAFCFFAVYRKTQWSGEEIALSIMRLVAVVQTNIFLIWCDNINNCVLYASLVTDITPKGRW